MLLIDDAATAGVLEMPAVVGVLERSYRELAAGEVICRPRIDTRYPVDGEAMYQWGTIIDAHLALVELGRPLVAPPGIDGGLTSCMRQAVAACSRGSGADRGVGGAGAAHRLPFRDDIDALCSDSWTPRRNTRRR